MTTEWYTLLLRGASPLLWHVTCTLKSEGSTCSA